jgi:hypothetical protein
VVLVAVVMLTASLWPVFGVPSFNWTTLIPVVLLPLAAWLAGGLFVLLRGLLSWFPRPFLWAAMSTLTALAFIFGSAGKRGVWVFSLWAITAGALAGAGVGSLRAPIGERPRGLDRAVTVSSLALGLVLLALGLGWLVWDGPAEKPIPDAARSSAAAVVPLALPDPGQPGPHAVRELTYGSGTDRHRPEFGAKAALRSRSVDGSLLVERWKGALGWARKAYWGFDAKHLPLQGRVWYPEGEGPFPIVLMVHGNHLAEDFSDPGYEYLGRLFASRGTIAVSVDENFLNSTVSDLLAFPDDGMSGENDARLVFDYGFGIRGIAAIAPVDGQYKPAGASTRLTNVSYFVLHGTHDGDMQSFHGARVFERVRFTDGAGHFKAGLYVHRANHGQFNTTWGRGDSGGLGNRFLNLRPLLPKEDQERVARVFLSAFVEAAVRGEAGYRALFRDHRRAAAWLPEVVCLQQYEDSGTRVLAGYEEDIDLTTGASPGARLRGENLSDWKEREAELKWSGLDTRAVWLGWDREKAKTTPSYALVLPDPGVEAGPDDVKPSELVFDTFELPLAAFKEATPGLDPSRLRAVRFLFDRTEKGVVVLDDLAIR